MKIRRTKKSSSAPTARRSAPAQPARARQRAIDNSGAGRLPGSAGYPEGPRTALPVFFEMRRPDGRPE